MITVSVDVACKWRLLARAYERRYPRKLPGSSSSSSSSSPSNVSLAGTAAHFSATLTRLSCYFLKQNSKINGTTGTSTLKGMPGDKVTMTYFAGYPALPNQVPSASSSKPTRASTCLNPKSQLGSGLCKGTIHGNAGALQALL